MANRLLLFLPLWLALAFPAAASDEAVAAKLVAWQALLDPNSGADFDEIAQFIRDNPDWPEQGRLRLRAEMALKDSAVSDRDLLAWFGDDTPISGIGKIALAQALERSGGASQEKIADLVRAAWIGGDFDAAQEDSIRHAYRMLLTRREDLARTDRLLWEEKTNAAKRMLPLLPRSHQLLAEARIALIDDKRNASQAVGRVPSSLEKDPGLIYDRMRWRARRGYDSGVREMLLLAPEDVPYPARWWKYREMQVREAIDEKNHALAEKLLKHHGQQDGAELAEALWLKGWFDLEFRGRPKEAHKSFRAMHEHVQYPVSRARAAYWMGRASERMGDGAQAGQWYNAAAAFPTTFYGQLAALKRFGPAPLHIPAEPQASSGAFERQELARAVRVAAEWGDAELASRLIHHLVEAAEDPAEIARAARLGNEIGLPHIGVRAAKKALQKNVVLRETGYPLPETPPGLAVERPLLLAVMRQESEFDPNARSPAGALGMMQLMPRTAREVARKMVTGYIRQHLYQPEYNMLLGSHYLSRLIEAYGGSYVMAAAAYNAGPGNVRKWTAQFGTPGGSIEEAVAWIEKIPFAETRNYVQRVIENLQVYRTLEGGRERLQIEEDLTR